MSNLVKRSDLRTAGKAAHQCFSGPVEWKPALVHAVPVWLFILSLFYYWFAVADRCAVFLYGHLGATPFDEVTSGRYWMSGLVASGAVVILYATANWFLGRIAALRCLDYRPPAWWHVWALCAPPLIIGITIITMTANWPTLPPLNGGTCVIVTLSGLALALTPGSLAAQRPVDLVWLVFDGMGLMPTLLLLQVIELPGRGLRLPFGANSANIVYLVAVGGTLAGALWLVIMTGLRAWRRRPWPGAGALFVAGLCLSYLLMPLAHHLLATPPEYRYITAASNFFAFNTEVQLLVFFVAAALVVGITQFRQYVQARHEVRL